MRYWTFSIAGAKPGHRSKRSKSDRPRPKLCARWEQHTGGSCFWSPTSTTCPSSARSWSATKALGSVTCDASSSKIKSNDLCFSAFEPQPVIVEHTTSASLSKFLTMLPSRFLLARMRFDNVFSAALNSETNADFNTAASYKGPSAKNVSSIPERWPCDEPSTVSSDVPANTSSLFAKSSASASATASSAASTSRKRRCSAETCSIMSSTPCTSIC
mmetsp:Transcript_16487/g.57674  ORF Transcript_16487/g.57674 Transcript_16487/m.57674 type:complete len:216 (-) Transcript_16487:728-1375(-)